MISYCSIPGNDSTYYVNIYIYDVNKRRFVLQTTDTDLVLSKVITQNPKDICFDSNGELQELNIKLT